MSERYGMLPSQVLEQATTLDLYIMDAALSYHNAQIKKQNGQVPEVSQDELQELLNLTRKKK
jgi:hypothetical protein